MELAQPQFEYPPPQQQFIPAYFDDLNQMRKKNQQEELRMAYQQQIAEREQRRVDDLRRKIQEEREEEERLRNKRGMEQRWMDEEYNRKLAQELLARQLLAEREAAERRKWGTGTRGTHRPPPTPPMELPVEQPVPEPVVEEVVVDPVDEEAEREKRMREMKAELYGEMTKQVQGVLDHEMGKLKGQMDVQNKILRDQVLTLKVNPYSYLPINISSHKLYLQKNFDRMPLSNLKDSIRRSKEQRFMKISESIISLNTSKMLLTCIKILNQSQIMGISRSRFQRERCSHSLKIKLGVQQIMTEN